MNSFPVIRGRLAGYLEDFGKSPTERRTPDHRARAETKNANPNASIDRDSSREAATVREGPSAQATEPAAAPAPTAAMRGHLIDRLV